MGDHKVRKGKKQSSPGGDKKDTCPCKQWIDDAVFIQCDKCDTWWHCRCVSLKGLTEAMVYEIEFYECPRCFTSPHVPLKESPIKGEIDCNVLRNVMKQELKIVVDDLKDTMKDAATTAIKKATPNVVSSVVEQTKTYAAAAQENQKRLVEEVKSAATSTQLVEKICQKMDNDSVQREMKKTNILISNVPEPDSALSGKDKKEADIVYLCKNFEMERNEIINCFRTGTIRTDSSGEPIPRPIVAVMLDEETARYWHNEGKGYRIGSSWINPDLCRVDRENQFLARQERRKRREQVLKKEEQKTEKC